jgi:hypothetical protein
MEDGLKSFLCLGRQLARGSALLQNPPGVTNMPIVLVQLSLNQLKVRELAQVFPEGLRRRSGFP